MTILTAHQPLYIPWLGFFHKVAISDIFVLLDDIQFINDDYIHRNKIKTQSGWQWLTIPVLNHLGTKINKLKIDDKQYWYKKHLKSIYFNYFKSPYFDSYKDFFYKTYNTNWNNIVDLDVHILKYLFKELGINVKIIKSSDNTFIGTKSLRLVNMCKELNVTTFIFGSNGINYADINLFNKNNIKIVFQHYNHPIYNQLHGEFIPNLSILDLLFNCGEKSYSILTSNNISKEDIK